MSYPDCSLIVLKTAGGSHHFREANPGLPSENGVSTSSLSVDDAVCWTGGTTAAPKDSYAIWKELREGARACKPFLLQADLPPGDRVVTYSIMETFTEDFWTGAFS